MSFFNWCEVDKAREPEQPEPKGLELKIIPERMEVIYLGKSVGCIEIFEGKYIYISNSVSIYDNGSMLDSVVLRGIAAKLDELNGVHIDRDKLENELHMLIMRGTAGMSGSDIMRDMIRMKEIKNILNNP